MRAEEWQVGRRSSAASGGREHFPFSGEKSPPSAADGCLGSLAKGGAGLVWRSPPQSKDARLVASPVRPRPCCAGGA